MQARVSQKQHDYGIARVAVVGHLVGPLQKRTFKFFRAMRMFKV